MVIIDEISENFCIATTSSSQMTSLKFRDDVELLMFLPKNRKLWQIFGSGKSG